MTGSETTIDVQSIEELTVHSLDRSAEGLEALIVECKRCGEAMINEPVQALITYLPAMAEQLHAFHAFELSLFSMFQLEPELIADAEGSLKNCDEELNQQTQALMHALEKNDFATVSEMLRCDVPRVLNRFKRLLPMLRHYIDVEYMQTPEVAG